VFDAMKKRTTMVSPSEAPEFTGGHGAVFVDLCGCETIRHPDYRSLLSPAAKAAVDDGIFAGLEVASKDFSFDAAAALQVLEPFINDVRLPKASASAKFSLFAPPVLKTDLRALDEYLAFLAWGRDADNRGRRLGLDRFYDDTAMKTLLEAGPHFDLLDKIHDVQQSDLGLHQPAARGN